MFHNHQNRMNNPNFGNKCGNWSGKRAWGQHWAQKMQGGGRVAANIEETDDAFVISLAAPGIDKQKISLNVKDDVLTIAYTGTDAASEGAETKSSFTYQEFGNASFERKFQLNAKVSTDAISATYADGILKVTMPKNPETNKPAQNINVA